MRMEYDIADTVHRSRFSVLELQSSALGFCVRGAHDVGRLISVSVASPSCEENGDADRTRGRTAAPVATAAGTYHTAHVPYVHRRRELIRDAPELIRDAPEACAEALQRRAELGGGLGSAGSHQI